MVDLGRRADLVRGLGESVCGVRSGNVDLANGIPVKALELYEPRLYTFYHKI